jgi:hypothetical protein
MKQFNTFNRAVGGDKKPVFVVRSNTVNAMHVLFTSEQLTAQSWTTIFFLVKAEGFFPTATKRARGRNQVFNQWVPGGSLLKLKPQEHANNQ